MFNAMESELVCASVTSVQCLISDQISCNYFYNAGLFFQKTERPKGSGAMSPGKTVKHFVTPLATTDNCVLNMCVSVYTSFPLESVTLTGGWGTVLGGLQLTLQGLQGYSASAFCQILRFSHSWLSVMV